MASINVMGMDVPQGERRTQVLQPHIAGRQVDVPLIVINGAHDGPRVTITGGVHGAEYVAIEATRRLGMEIDPAEVHGTLVVVPISNTTAFRTRSIYTSGLDDNNLNRMFPGNESGAPSEALALWLFREIISPSQFFIDMHGGDMIEALVPFVLYCETDNKEVEEQSHAMAFATGLPRVIRGVTSGSAYGAATAAGIPAIISEVGGQGLWSDEVVELHRGGATRVLQLLGVLPGTPEPAGEQKLYTHFTWSRAEADGLLHPAVQVGDWVEEGQHLADIVDYFGKPLQSIDAAHAGEIVFLVTSLAINRGDPILSISA